MEAFFNDLKRIYKEEKVGADQIFIMEDFNAKLGKSSWEHMGKEPETQTATC